MERSVLEGWLTEGISLEEMGRRAERHPSTISYWLGQHGLVATHAGRYAMRGSLSCERLVGLVGRDLSIREIAAEVDRSPSTVRYWMKRHGLRTTTRARAASAPSAARREGDCRVHGPGEFIVRPDGSARCVRCRADAVSHWRREAKRILVEEAGGACELCGYDGCLAALQFHHVDPQTKRFGIGSRGLARAIEVLREEAAKCILVCANCHAELENGSRSRVDSGRRSATAAPDRG